MHASFYQLAVNLEHRCTDDLTDLGKHDSAVISLDVLPTVSGVEMLCDIFENVVLEE